MNQFHLNPRFLSGYLPSRFFFPFASLTVAILLTAGNISAQATVDTVRIPSPANPESKKITDTIIRVAATLKRSTSLQKSSSSIKIAESIDSAVEKSYAAAMVAYYNALERKNIADAIAFDSLASYNSWALKNRMKVIEKQQVFAKIIFVLVIIVVLSGLIFSALQFRNAIKNSNKKSSVSDTTLKATLGGIEVSSSILGVIILTLSIVFFYLYLTKVYPVVLVN